MTAAFDETLALVRREGVDARRAAEAVAYYYGRSDGSGSAALPVSCDEFVAAVQAAQANVALFGPIYDRISGEHA